MAKLKVGLIGCGWLAQSVHLRILTHMPDVEVVALAEPDAQRQVEASRRVPRADVCGSYHELLKMPQVEAVLICVPTALHAEVAVAALEQGKHIYLEKPLATNLDEAQRVMAAWRRAGVVGMTGFNYRFNPLFQSACQTIRSGRLGALVGVCTAFSTASHSLPAWKRARESGGGVLLDLASHHVDLVRFLFDQEVQRVSAEVRSQGADQDTAVLQLRLEDGLPIQSFFSFNSIDEDRFDIYGQAGKLTIDRYRSWDVEITDAGRTPLHLQRMTQKLKSFVNVPYLFNKMRSPWHEPSFREALSRFVSATCGGEKASPDLLDGYRSLEVIWAAEQSAQTGQTVSPMSSAVDL